MLLYFTVKKKQNKPNLLDNKTSSDINTIWPIRLKKMNLKIECRNKMKEFSGQKLKSIADKNTKLLDLISKDK